MIVGAPAQNFSSDSRSTGSVYFFEFVDGAWVERQQVFASDAAIADHFGLVVDIDGDWAIATAKDNDEFRGSAYILERTNDGWVEDTVLNAPVRPFGDEFGFSAAISGNFAIVGKSFTNPAYVFARTDTGWVLDQELYPEDSSAVVAFGSRVDISGNKALVAYPGFEGWRGAGYMFERNDSVWVLTDTLLDSRGSAGDNYPVSVALDGDIAAMSTPFAVAEVLVFVNNGGTWAEEARLAISGDVGISFGHSIAIEGPVLVSGATLDEGVERLGSAVSVSGGHVAVSTPRTPPAFRVGRVYVYEGVSSPVAIEYLSSEIPTQMELEQNYPNPFNPTTSIRFSLAEPATVHLGVYNVFGQLVVTLADGQLPAGKYATSWDGRTASGDRAASGAYLYRLQSTVGTLERKMVLAK